MRLHATGYRRNSSKKQKTYEGRITFGNLGMQFSAVSKVLVYQRKSCALYKMRETSYYCYEIQQPKSRLCKSKALFKTNCCIVHVLSMQKSLGLVLLCDRMTTMWIDVDIHYARHAKHDCSVRFTAFQKCITWPPVMRDMSSIAWQQDDLGFPKYAVFDTTAMCPAKKSACLPRKKARSRREQI